MSFGRIYDHVLRAHGHVFFREIGSARVQTMPSVGAVMECTMSEKGAHLAYVEKVFPDQSIQISEADWPDRGIYNERILTESEWHERAPLFITIG